MFVSCVDLLSVNAYTCVSIEFGLLMFICIVSFIIPPVSETVGVTSFLFGRRG